MKDRGDSLFNQKLNIKKDGVYKIEEKINLSEGRFNGYLKHSNVVMKSVVVYTGPKMTGEKIETFYLSKPEEATWRTLIKVFSETPAVYINYETPGDQVDAQDINRLQEGVTNNIGTLSEKVDKVEGKELSDENYTAIEKSKLATVEDEANNYKHPATHSAEIILENKNKRFVTDEEKTRWDADDGDMKKSTYDTSSSGVVDNAEKLGGKLPDEFMKAGPLTWNNLKGE